MWRDLGRDERSLFYFILVPALLYPIHLVPDVPLLPWRENVFVASILLGSGMVLFTSGGRIVGARTPLLFLVAVAGLFWAWGIVTLFGAGEHLADGLRRLVLAIGSTIAVLVAFVYARPTPSLGWLALRTLALWGGALSTVGLLIFFLGDAPGWSERYSQNVQSLRLLGLELSQAVHLSRGFPIVASLTGNPNFLGFAAGLSVLASTALVLRREGHRAVWGVVLGLSLAGLILSFSRGSMLGAAAGLAMLLLLHSKRSVLVGFGLLGVVSMALVIVFSVVGHEQVLSALASGGQRDLIWGGALESIARQPFGGVGFGLESERVFAPMGISHTMHNAYLVVLAETGVVGLFLFLVFLAFSILFLVLKVLSSAGSGVRELYLVVLAIVVFFLVRSIVETAIWRFSVYNVIFVFLLAMAMRLWETEGGCNSKVTALKPNPAERKDTGVKSRLPEV